MDACYFGVSDPITPDTSLFKFSSYKLKHFVWPIAVNFNISLFLEADDPFFIFGDEEIYKLFWLELSCEGDTRSFIIELSKAVDLGFFYVEEC